MLVFTKRRNVEIMECHYTEAWQESMNVNFNSCKTEQKKSVLLCT